MSQTTAVTSTARLSAEGDKIVLVGPYDPKLVEFYRSLPRARWNKVSRVWTCDATPGAAWRIRERDGIETTDGMDDVLFPLSFRLCGLPPMQGTNNLQPVTRRTDGWKHQLRAYHFSLPREAALLAMDMGTGKSKVVIDLITNCGYQRVLILCPKSVLDVWQDQFTEHAAHYPHLLILTDGSVKWKTKAADKWLRLEPGKPHVVVINYDGARRTPFAEWSLSQDWDLVVLDESARAKAPNGVTAKYIEKLARVAKRRLCLTGTPMPHSKSDVFSQCRFLDAGLYGTSFYRFKHHYFELGGFEGREIVGFKNEDEFNRLLGLVMFQCGDEVLDLPPTQDHYRRFELSATARQHYDELERDLITEIEGGVVTAANVLVKLLRLQQVTSGYLRIQGEKIVRDDIVPFDEDAQIDTGKAELLAELLEDMGPAEKVVVFCKFTHDVDAVVKVAESLGRGPGVIDGRYNDYKAWKAGRFDAKPCDTLAVQIQAGSLGIDLTEARYCVLYSTGFLSPGDMNQVRKRIHRPGQERPVHYYHLLARGTVDETVIAVRKKRADVVQGVLDALKKGDTS